MMAYANLDSCKQGHAPSAGACRLVFNCPIGGCGDNSVKKSFYDRGDILPAGESGSGAILLRVIRSGMIATSATLPDGRRQLFCLRLPGDVMRPANDHGGLHWDEALAPTEICEAVLAPDRATLLADRTRTETYLNLAEAELESGFAHRLLLGRFTARERLCAFLTAMVKRARGPHGNDNTASLPLSREDIADFLCLNPATVSREIKNLKAKGLVRFPSPTVCEVLDLAGLEAVTPMQLKLCGQPQTELGLKLQ